MRTRLASAARFLFGDSARAFGTLSAVLLALLAVVPAKDYLREWRGYQKGYLRLVRGRSDAVSLTRRFQPGLQQRWLPALGVVDRCSTCHSALKESTLAGVKAQPFRPHPAMPHSLTEFGCVLCHRGQGAATTVEEAHRSTKSWEDPILPARYLEASCGQCHLERLTGTPLLNPGRETIAAYGCVRCHVIKDAGRRTHVRNGRSAITGAHRGEDQPGMDRRVAQEPAGLRRLGHHAEFPIARRGHQRHPRFPDRTEYAEPGGEPEAVAPVPDDAAAQQQGASLYGESFCASCHATQNAAGTLVGGTLGPELTRVGSKVKTAWLAAWLRNPAAYDPDTKMPHYRLDEKQIALLLAFLGNKTDADFVGNLHFDPATSQQIEHGKRLVNERGCASCHEINGVPRPDNFAPELTLVGSRPLAKILFAPGMPHTLPDYIAAKIRQPRSFGDALKMPQYTLAPQQVDALVTALLAQTERAQGMPAALRVASRRTSDYRAAGKAGQLIEDMRCFSCHTINGRGGDMAPELTWEGTAVTRPWLVSFLKNPNTLRPALIRRMPRFNMTEAEANTLADYIMTVYQTPEFDRDSLDGTRFTTADVEQGRGLFYGKYACQSCHIVDPDQDKGYVGPTLTQAGARLSAAWIFHWLKNADKLRPGTLEPIWNMADEDARALTAFVMAQKNEPRKEAVAK